MSAADRLRALVEAEHAAVYGYALLGARLDDAGRRAARTAYDSHRARRDQLIAALGGIAPAPLAAYDVTVANPAEALALAVRIEAGMSLRWRDLVGATDDRALRALGVAGLQESAVRAAQWRKRTGTVPATVALPGTD
ncbi:MAG: ferritin-like domain-containing protein [Mycobacteriales bacterium]